MRYNSEGLPLRIDHSILGDICGGREDLRVKILREYLRVTPGLVHLLTQHIDGGAFDEAKAIAHSLRGSSGTIGATALETALFCLESSTDPLTVQRVLLPNVLFEHDCVREEIHRIVGGL